MSQSGHLGKGKPGILLAAVGPGEKDRHDLLPAIQAEVEDRFPGLPVAWCFTGPRAGGRDIAAVCGELSKQGVQSLAVQPFFCLQGTEYRELEADLRSVAEAVGIQAQYLGKPLLGTDEDPSALAGLVRQYSGSLAGEVEAVLWIAHGSTGQGDADVHRVFGLLSGETGPVIRAASLLHVNEELPAVARMLKRERVKRVVLTPFLAFSGHHALADMGGNGPDSWKTLLQNQGLYCEARTEGLAAIAFFRALWLERLAEVVARLRA